MNNVSLIGRLTKDPVAANTPSGIAYCRFTLAVNRIVSGSDGEKKADFISCVAWRKQAENLAKYQKKGSLISLTGKIQTGSYEGQGGKRIYTTDIVAEDIQYLEKAKSNSNETPGSTGSNADDFSSNHNTSGAPFTSYESNPVEVHGDDLPF